MKRFALVVLLMVLAPTIAFAATSAADALTVAAGVTEQGSIATLSRPIVVNGVVEGDVTSIIGSITVRGAVEGDVVSLFGDVIFEEGALAEGHVMAAAGEVALPVAGLASNKTVISGNLDGQGVSSLLPGKREAPLSLGERMLFALVLGGMACGIAILLGMIWPRSIGAAARAIELAPERAMGLGMVWTLLSGVVFALLLLLLVMSLVGLAIVPLLGLILQVPYLLGLAVAGRVLGERLGLRGLAAEAAGCGLLVLPSIAAALINLLPAFGIFYVLTSIGIGGLVLLRVSVGHRHSALV